MNRLYLKIILFFFIVSKLYSNNIQKIIVIGKKDTYINKYNNNSTYVITEDEIKKSGAKSITEILKNVPGIYIKRYGVISSPGVISIRGSSNEEILVLIDGNRINTSTAGGIDFSTININSIKKIEIIKNGNTAIYGEGAFGGIINIITKDNIEDIKYLKLKYTYGSFNTHIINLALSHYYKRFGYYLNISPLISDGGYLFNDQKRGDIKKRINTGINSLNIEYKLKYIINKYSYIQQGIKSYISERGVPGSIEFPTYSATMYDRNILTTFLYTYYKKSKINISLSYLNRYRHFINEDFFLGKIDEKNEVNSSEADIYLKRKNKMILNNIFKSGVDFQYQKLFSTDFEKSGILKYKGTISKSIYSLYIIEKIFLIKDKLIFNNAIRYTKSSLYPYRINYSSGIIFIFDKSEKNILKFSFENSYKEPSFEDLFLPDTGFAAGNPDLKPEEAINYEVSLSFSLYKWLKNSIIFYQKNINNLIQWQPGAGGKWRPQNIQKVKNTGIEFEQNMLFPINFYNSFLTITYNYSLMFATDKSDNPATYNKQLPYRPFETANLIINLSNNKLFSLQFESNFVGFRYLTAHNSKYLDSYLIHNLNFIIYLTSKLNFSFLVKNFTNNKYIDIRGYPVPGIEIYTSFRIKI